MNNHIGISENQQYRPHTSSRHATGRTDQRCALKYDIMDTHQAALRRRHATQAKPRRPNVAVAGSGTSAISAIRAPTSA